MFWLIFLTVDQKGLNGRLHFLFYEPWDWNNLNMENVEGIF